MGMTGLQLTKLLVLSGDTLNEPLRRDMTGYKIPEKEQQLQKERIKAAYEGRRIDRAPVAADIRWWFAEKVNDGVLEEACEGLDLEPVLISSGIVGSAHYQPFSGVIPNVTEEHHWTGLPVVYKNGGFPGSTHTIIMKTPAGELRTTESYASRSFGITEYPVKEFTDLKTALYIYEQYAKIPNRENEAPPVSATPFQNFLMFMAGVLNGTFMLHDNPREVEAFMRELDEIQIPDIEEAAGKAETVVCSCENLAADVSGGYFDKYLGPQLKRRSDICAKHGRKYGIHQDGMLAPLLGRLKEAGIGYVNGLTAMPSGDLEPEEIRAAAGPDIVLHDIIPQCVFMPEFHEREFEAYIRRVVGFYKNDNRIIWGIGDMLPCVSDIRRFKTMLDIVKEITTIQ